jgi:8-oxo-dGTP pyrophosphatase MutT (NUDIX family)
MNLNELVGKLDERLKLPLPGPDAHEPLRAVPSGIVKPRFEHKVPPKPGGVLILLYEEDGVIKFPLTKRPDYLGTHGGQISFPGGKTEPDEDVITTALREGEEEIGVIRSDIQVIGRLSNFFVIPSNFIVTPVIGYLNYRPQFIPDPKEVDRVLEGNLEQLLTIDAIRTKEILAAKLYPMMAPHFEIDGEVVWGATAMILNEFRMVISTLLR